ncbi:hypothetical protein KY314_04900 [Candidatus Woesearchaeota archaeon]|nr:hypothetical protein [Candidatus Woesearchaeota archaeon]
MLDKLRNLFVKKEEVHDSGLALSDSSFFSIKDDLNNIENSLDNLKDLAEKGFKVSFKSIPSDDLSDLIENIISFSSFVEVSDVKNKVEVSELLAKMHDNAVKCSSMTSFLVGSFNSEEDLKVVLDSFNIVKDSFKKINTLLH